MWLMNGTVHVSSVSLGNVDKQWKIVGSDDFNGDGKTDILWQHSSGARSIWLMNGTVHTSSVSLGNVDKSGTSPVQGILMVTARRTFSGNIPSGQGRGRSG